ncbi:GNAT family N-acetyltransferase [Enterococcus faecalis]|uniref:GNAT family N-acetyltransferase n=1 Tax=Enterococcus faecalis TaxID=1351 RepID=UPI001F55AD53|nr:GNAT family protein [Enterococcus faecalis]
MENVLKGKHVGFSHFREEYIEHIAKQQWDNELLRHLSWDALHPWGLEEWKDFTINKGEDDRFLFAILQKEQRGQGYGFEAVSLICKFAFYELGLHKIRLAVNSNNQKAIHVYEKVGFKKEGIDREALFQDGQWLDIYNYGILQKEWLQMIKAES